MLSIFEVKRFTDNRGAIQFKTLFWLIIVASFLYGAYVVAPPYAGYYMLKTEIEDEAKLGHMYTDQTIQRRILEKASTWSVPISDENLEIAREKEQITISADYTVTFNFLDKYKKEQKFHVEVTKPLKESSGALH
ncbi:MAG: DUF4845 domain-containing protein [Deltaproteobacteria bacterium]|nr:DUF4845 domain-containing protein [Deltaproteobacteria bacterium]